MQWYGGNRRTECRAFSVMQSMTYCFTIFLRMIRIFSSNTDFVGIGFEISISCFDMAAITSPFFIFMVGAFAMNLQWYFALSITTTTFLSLGKFTVNVFSNQSAYGMESSFPQSKRGVFYKAFTAPSMAYYYRFYSWGWSWYKSIFVPSDQSTRIVSWKKVKYCLSKRLSNHPRGTSALWLSICTSKQRVLDFS